MNTVKVLENGNTESGFYVVPLRNGAPFQTPQTSRGKEHDSAVFTKYRVLFRLHTVYRIVNKESSKQADTRKSY